MNPGPHGGASVQQFGSPPGRARTTVIALHGRGASSRDMYSLADHIGIAEVAYLAPTAAGQSWWPTSFLAPHRELQPFLDSALALVDNCIDGALEEGADPARVVVLGFSQGACLALEFAARTSRALHALIGLSGGLVGTGDAPEAAPSDSLYGYTPKAFDYSQSKLGLSVYLGCHERDPHIPLVRVVESASVFEDLGASVSTDIFPGAGHGVVVEEIEAVRAVLNSD